MAIASKTTREALIALINKDNNATLTEEDIKLSAPKPIDGAGEGERNTTVDVDGLDADRLTGSVTVKYWRRPPTDHFGEDTQSVSFFDASATEATVKENITKLLLTDRKIPFDEDSYSYSSVIALDPGDDESDGGKYNWKAVIDFSTNYILYGTLVVYASSNTRNLDDIITVADLSGFTADDVK